MQIEINTDKTIKNSEGLTEHVRHTVTKAVGHFSDRLTRVVVHLSDENGDKKGPLEQKCVMEARPRGLQPLAVSHTSDNMHMAVVGAAERLHNIVANQFGRLERR